MKSYEVGYDHFGSLNCFTFESKFLIDLYFMCEKHYYKTTMNRYSNLNHEFVFKCVCTSILEYFIDFYQRNI